MSTTITSDTLRDWRAVLMNSLPHDLPFSVADIMSLIDAAEERDRVTTERDDLRIACDMYKEAIDNLTTFVTEEYGPQPVQGSAVELVSTLERLAFERRQQDEVERKERDRLKTSLDQTRALWEAETKVSVEWCAKATVAQQEVDILRARLRELEEALRPFAEIGRRWEAIPERGSQQDMVITSANGWDKRNKSYKPSYVRYSDYGRAAALVDGEGTEE